MVLRSRAVPAAPQKNKLTQKKSTSSSQTRQCRNNLNVILAISLSTDRSSGRRPRAARRRPAACRRRSKKKSNFKSGSAGTA
jgi:hypothetical protein